MNWLKYQHCVIHPSTSSCPAALGLHLTLKYPCVNVYVPSPLRVWMLLLLVSPSIVGDRGKVVELSTWGICLPVVGVIEIRKF